ncbi:hypothetical protein Ahia01_000675900 [Argonauta hians]
MNCFLILAAAICCFFSGAQAYTQADLNAVCKENYLKESTISSVQPHPHRCDAFLICVPSHPGFKAVEKGCPSGLMFDSNYLVCNWAVAVTCNQACSAGDKFKHLIACDTYFECKNNKFDPTAKKCTSGERFDAKTKTCVADSTCGKPVGVETVPCSTNFKPTEVPGTYQQKDNGVWTIKACPKNLGFSMKTCKCTDSLIADCPSSYKANPSDQNSYFKLESKTYVKKTCSAGEKFSLSDCACHTTGSGKCSTIDISFSSDTSDKYNSYVQNENVQVSGGYGVFDGTGYLVLPITNNNDYGDTFKIKFTFNAGSSQLSNDIALFGNDRCDDTASFKVSLDGKTSGSISLTIDTVFGSTSYSDKATNLKYDTDYAIEITKQDKDFKVNVNSVQAVSKTYAGTLPRNKCSYGIGNLKSKSNFKGKIKDFYFSKCI